MQEVVQRYGEVARSVNQREFKRFCDDIRQKWNPLPPPPEDEFWEEGHRGEGWTEEGAFAMCVYQEAVGSPTDNLPERQEPLCEAEIRKQVLFRPLDSLLGEIRHGPLFDPQPEEKIREALATLKADLQRQADETAPTESISVELPKDFEQLVRITDGVSGAGVPSETAGTYLAPGISRLQVESGRPGESEYLDRWWCEDWTPFAAWKLGGCTQHRQIYYVLCRDSHNTGAPIAWRVFDKNDIELEVYDSFSEFLEHQTLHIEARPGGHKQEHVLFLSRYPDDSYCEMGNI